MVNWKFIEENYKEGCFACSTIEEAKEFLKACEEHGVKWLGGEKPTEWNGWKSMRFGAFTGNKVVFHISDGMLLTHSSTKDDKKFEYEFEGLTIVNKKDQMLSELNAVNEAYKKFRGVASKVFCGVHRCGSCEVYSDDRVAGYKCWFNQMEGMIARMEQTIEKHKFEKEMTVGEIEKILGYKIKVVKGEE